MVLVPEMRDAGATAVTVSEIDMSQHTVRFLVALVLTACRLEGSCFVREMLMIVLHDLFLSAVAVGGFKIACTTALTTVVVETFVLTGISTMLRKDYLHL